MSLKLRVKFRMDELGMNPAQVSKAAGFSPTFIRDLLDGRKKSVRTDALEKLAEVLQVTTAWLHGEGPLTVAGGARLEFGSVDAEEILLVPIYDIRASAGAGALVEDGPPTAWQPYRASRLARWNIRDLAIIHVSGDSMWDKFHDGDLVLVNRAEQRIVKPGVYILLYEGELLMKRCQRNLDNGSVMVKSDNPIYDSFVVSDADSLHVLGRVVASEHWIG